MELVLAISMLLGAGLIVSIQFYGPIPLDIYEQVCYAVAWVVMVALGWYVFLLIHLLRAFHNVLDVGKNLSKSKKRRYNSNLNVCIY